MKKGKEILEKFKRYWTVFKISLEQEFVYRLNFIMWRVRNVIQMLLIFFLWDVVFRDPSRVVFGYDRAKIITYVFGLLIVRSIVTSARSVDVAGEISDGRLTNYLLRPMSYFKYWFTRDVSSKALNLFFAVIEFSLLFLLLKPSFFFQTNILYLSLFFISLTLAIVLYFLLLMIFSLPPLWYPEGAWAMVFILFVLIDLLGGGVFPLDILPLAIQKGLYLTPFPYLMFIPLQIYLGKLNLMTCFGAVFLALFWVGALSLFLNFLWNTGLRNYRSEGR